MYVKTIKKNKDWRFGLAYFHSELGDVFHVDAATGFAMREAGVAELAKDSEIPKEENFFESTVVKHEDVFQVILKKLTAKDGK